MHIRLSRWSDNIKQSPANTMNTFFEVAKQLQDWLDSYGFSPINLIWSRERYSGYHYTFLKSAKTSLVVESKITAYFLSDTFFPALILSVTHSGLTTYGLFFDLFVKYLCVFKAFRFSWDVTICVALDAVCLFNEVSASTAQTWAKWKFPHDIWPPASWTTRFTSMSVVSFR